MSNTNTDAIVLDLFNKVREKQKEISSVQRVKWETSCTIGYNPETVADRINIQTITDLAKLVDIYGFLSQKLDKWNESTLLLGVKLPFKWMGYSYEQWTTDIKNRVAQINVNVKKKELENMEERLNKLITVEQRRTMELEALQKEFAAS